MLCWTSLGCGDDNGLRPPVRDLVDAGAADTADGGDDTADGGSIDTPPDPGTASTDDASQDLAVCVSHADCDDENPCTTDLCDVAGLCINAPSNGACDDGDACTDDDICTSGRCAGTPIDCPVPSDTCQTATCHPTVGCVPECRDAPECTRECAIDADCDDGDPDSVDICSLNTCSAACRRLWPLCDDDNPCTADHPNDDGECANEPLDGPPCEDGSFCTVDERCIAGVCAGVLVACNDDNTCTADYCNPAFGCVSERVPDGVGCDDGDACTTQDTCINGTCHSTPVVCPDDDDPCSLEFCDSAIGCTAYCRQAGDCAPACTHDSDCIDEDPCTTDRCVATACTSRCKHTEPTCDDGEYCTVDYCDPEVGACRHIVFCEECVFDVDCDNGDPCTEDYCSADKFCERDPITCPEDDDPCTVTYCQAGVGCTFECREPCDASCNSHEECDDGDACTEDLCVLGDCGLRCLNRGRECSPPGPCTVSRCVVGGCVDSVPTSSPTLDGGVGEDWHSASLAALELDPSDWPRGYLTELHVQIDANLLFIGIRGLAADSTQAIVGYLDVDQGNGTGVHLLSAIQGGTGPLDEALSGCAVLTSPAFGVDVAFGTVGMASAWGAADLAGWRRLNPDGGLRRILAGALMASEEEHGVEATIPLDSILPGGVPPEGAAMALVVLLTEIGDGCRYADQTLPNQTRSVAVEEPHVAAAYRFLVQPALEGCCVVEGDCRDADPCTQDVCTPAGVCDHLDTGCIPP